MNETTLEILGLFATFGLPLVGVLSFFRSQISRMDQKIDELNHRVTEHRSNADAHVTREWVQSLDARLGGPSDREWGEYVNELREVRHDLRNITHIVRLMKEG